MSVSIDNFWKLARASSLLKAEQCTSLHHRFQSVRGADQVANARALALWLINEQIITSYQAKVLLSGKPGPFIFGDYRLGERIESPRDVRRFDGVHTPTNHRVLLHFWLGSWNHWETARAQSVRHQSLNHPHLDRCYETVQINTHRLAISEDVEGHTLGQLMSSSMGIPTVDAIQIAYQIALALSQIHTAQLVHGCVVPDEIVIQSGNHAKLRRMPLRLIEPIDFSSADPKDCLRQQSDYLAPELQRIRQPPDRLSDIYALGCILYEMLSGQPPFPGGTVTEKMQRHATEAIRPLEEFRAMPTGLSEVVSFMMAKKPGLRYQRSVEVAQKLEAFRVGSAKVVSARPRATEAFYLAHLQKQCERIPTHLLGDGDATTPAEAVPPAAAPGVTAAAVASATDTTPLLPEAPIVTTPPPTPRQAASATGDRSRWPSWAAAFAALIVLVAATYFLVLNSAHDSEVGALNDDPIVTQRSAPDLTQMSALQQTKPTTTVAPDDNLVNDDGQTLWQSPTSGAPIEFDFAPPASQMFVIARPSAILASAEGPAALKALGPLHDRIQQQFGVLGLPLANVDQVLIALTPQDVDLPLTTLVAHVDSEQSLAKVLEQVEVEESSEGKRWRIGSIHAVAPTTAPRVICFGTEETLREILAVRGTPPLLKRQLERLRRLSDRDRHLTILWNPHFLDADGRETLSGQYAMLREPIRDLLGDQVQAASLSLHFDDSFYGELRLASSLDQDPFHLAAACRQRLSEMPEQLNHYLGRVTIERFWQPLALRFPLMINFMHQQTRIGVTDECAMVNFVMPEKSAHNLILASQLAVEAAAASGLREAPATKTKSTDWQSILAHKMDLEFPQLSLEFAMRDFAAAVSDAFPEAGFQIKIVGGDLQLAGITRNQQIRDVALQQQTVDEILTQLVQRANPVRTPSVSNPDQKLIWVMAPPTESTIKTVLITSRTAATQKGYSLPKQFLANSPAE